MATANTPQAARNTGAPQSPSPADATAHAHSQVRQTDSGAASQTNTQPRAATPRQTDSGGNGAPVVAVLDPGMGNLRSVCRAWEAVGARVRLVRSPQELGEPAALVFPGQGGMPHCMDALQASGLDDTLRGWIGEDRPFFGICLGMQALFEYSEEGKRKGLGIFPGKVERFRLPPELKIPHMGWNSVHLDTPTPLCRQINDGLNPAGEPFYFVHSYHVTTTEAAIVWGSTTYGYSFVSAVARGNCMATQFHPEKSQAKGLQIYSNYVKYLKS